MKRRPLQPCRVCGAMIRVPAQSCRTCYDQVRQMQAAARHVCTDCGQARNRKPQTERCRRCDLKRRHTTVPRCLDCQRQIASRRKQRCQPCHYAALRARQGTVNGIVLPFSAVQFDNYLRRADVEWTISMLAAESGVSASALNAWRSGATKPREDELARVANVLGISACPDCYGQGIRYPDQAAVAAVVRTLTSVPARRMSSLEPVASGGLALEPNARSLTLGSQQLTLTQQEYRLLASLVRAQGRYVTGEELAAAIWQPEQSKEPSVRAVRVYIARLRMKCERARLGWPVVTGHGLGYRIEAAS